MAANDYAAIAARVQAKLGDLEADIWPPELLIQPINSAYEDVQRKLQLHGSASFKSHMPITVPASGATTVISTASTPALPADLLLPFLLREADESGNYRDMKAILNLSDSIQPADSFGVWEWRKNAIIVPPSTRQIVLDVYYWRTLSSLTTPSDTFDLTAALEPIALGAAYHAAASRLGAGSEHVVGLKTMFDEALSDLVSLHVKNLQRTPGSPSYRFGRNAKRRRRSIV